MDSLDNLAGALETFLSKADQAAQSEAPEKYVTEVNEKIAKYIIVNSPKLKDALISKDKSRINNELNSFLRLNK
jgi:hypothetical protein